jgi:hypothetical protein
MSAVPLYPEQAPITVCDRLGGDNFSELSANYRPLANKTGDDNSTPGSLRVNLRPNCSPMPRALWLS